MVSHEEENLKYFSTSVPVPATASESVSNKEEDVSSNLNVVADDLYDNDEAITDTGFFSEEDTNSNLNAVDVDDEYWKEVRNNPIIVTDSPDHKNKSSPRIWNVFDSSSKF